MQNQLIKILDRHRGKDRRIGMGELYQQVFGVDWGHRINDTRSLRKLITQARREGVPVCSSTKPHGYWLAEGGNELSDYCKTLHSRALKILAQESRLRKVSLPKLIGQILINFEVGPQNSVRIGGLTIPVKDG